jgi:hypothetical protein
MTPYQFLRVQEVRNYILLKACARKPPRVQNCQLPNIALQGRQWDPSGYL